MTHPDRPTVRMREWGKLEPGNCGDGAQLRGLRLSDADRQLLATVKGRTSLKVVELREGLALSVGAHVGTMNLSCVRIVVMPKIGVRSLMGMVRYAFALDELVITESRADFASAADGLIDVLGLALLKAAERIARGGLLANYEMTTEDRRSPRGRLDMRYLATHPKRRTLRCVYDDLTLDHRLNQVLRAGLRLASRVMDDAGLCLDLARAADRLCPDLTRIELQTSELQSLLAGLDRRSSHYREALTLIALIHEGSYLGDHEHVGEMPLTSFSLNMNRVFERFLGRYLSESAPSYLRVSEQDVERDAFRYIENTNDWNSPRLRPDFVLWHQRRSLAVADAKYKNRHEHPPTTQELYQLTTYGLAYDLPAPREVLMLYPLAADEKSRPTSLLFGALAYSQQVHIRLVGVPLDGLLNGTVRNWWPWETWLAPSTQVIGKR